MVHVSDLGEDYFNYRPETLSMVGERSGVEFKMGDRVVVKVARADLDTCKIDLVLIGGGETKATRKKGKGQPEKASGKKSSKKKQPENKSNNVSGSLKNADGKQATSSNKTTQPEKTTAPTADNANSKPKKSRRKKGKANVRQPENMGNTVADVSGSLKTSDDKKAKSRNTKSRNKVQQPETPSSDTAPQTAQTTVLKMVNGKITRLKK